jgi:exosortase A-associated hydrolase 2
LIPIRFGSAERQLFGIYQAPSGSAARTECAVLCNPFGQEAIRSHRLFRILAERLARSGFHVLRFDYFATGDSAGDDHDADIDGWVNDVLLANEEIISRSNCRHVSWFGLKLGASIAALAATRVGRPPIRLILWDPIVSGSDYLQELADAHIAGLKEAFGIRWEIESGLREMVMQESQCESMGFPLSPKLKEQLRVLSASSLASLKAAHVTLLSDSSSKTAALRQYLAANGVSVNIAAITSQIYWASDEAMNSPIVPADALQAIIAAFLEQK